MKKFCSLCLALALGLFSVTASATAAESKAEQPELIGLYFYASWCSACKALEPELSKAQEKSKKLPYLQATLDMSNKVTQHQAGLLASALGLGEVYEETGVATGFVLLIDPETGTVVEKVSRDATADEIAAIIKSHL